VTTEELIVAIVRILATIPVLFWPFPGAIIAILGDLSDLFFMNLLDLGGIRDYQEFDKWLDQAYMITFLIVALRWQPVPRNIAVALFVYREVGFVVFQLTENRDLLILFPNVFEYWFVFVAALKFFHLEEGQWQGRAALFGLIPFRYSPAQLAAVLPLLTAAKLLHEYMLHIGRWFDGFTAVEAVEAIWHWLTTPFRSP
jgi:hypothetical protein